MRRSTDPEVIEPYLRDAAHFPGGHADAVCFPENEAEVAAFVSQSRALLAVGAQSSLTGGATPAGATVLSTRRMASASGWRAGSVVVEPGLVLRDLCEQIEARGQYYPPVPTYDGASVGGTVATNAAGAATFKYGSTRDWVERLRLVLADGEVLELHRGEVTARDDGVFEIVRADESVLAFERPQIVMPSVPKHSAGYYSAAGMDLIDLFIGAEGTLAVVSEIELRLVQTRPAWFAVLALCDGESAAIALAEELRSESLRTRARRDDRGLDVAAIEYMDADSLAIARADRAAERVGVALPPDAAAGLLIQVEVDAARTTAEVAAEIALLDDSTRDSPLLRLCRMLRRHGVLDTAVPALPGEETRRAALFALREAIPDGVNRRIREAQRNDGRVSKAACDVIVPFERFAESLSRYRRIARDHGIRHAIWGHISDGNVHPNLLPVSGEEMERANAAVLEIGQTAVDLGGSPMSEHGTGRSAVKQELLERLYGVDGVRSMMAVKRALDPRGVLAPNVLFRADRCSASTRSTERERTS